MGAPTASDVLPSRLRKWRLRRGLTTEALAQSMSDLGHPLHPSAITKTEKGLRGVTIDEWIAFAAALNVPPVALILPLDGSAARVRLTNKSEIHPHLALEWVIGEESLVDSKRFVIDPQSWQEGSQEVRLWRTLRVAQDAVTVAQRKMARSKFEHGTHERKDYVDALVDLVNVRREMERAGVTPPRLPQEWARDVRELRLERGK